MKKNHKVLFICFLFLVVSLALFLASFCSVESDYLWHIKAGEYMFHHGILKKDIFSWILSGNYWMSHEWLFEMMIYGMKQIFGNYHLFIYCFISLFSLLLLLFLPNKEKMKKNIPYSLIWILFSFILCVNIQGRPHLLSYSFLAGTIYLCMRLYENKEDKWIYLLPLIGILWSNFHGGSSNLVYLIPFLFFFIGNFHFKFKKIEANKMSKIQLKRYLFVTILCMISVCINTHGFKMFIYPYSNMLNQTMIQNINEWRCTSLSEPFHLVYFALLLWILGTLLFSKEKIRFLDVILLGFFIFLGLKSIRFWFYTYICASYILFDYVSSRKMDRGTITSIIIFACMLFGLFFVRRDSLKLKDYSYLLLEKDIEVIKKENPKRLFNMYDYGGDLIYNDILVFIDGRADLYSDYNYDDYLKISTLDYDTEKLIEKYDFDYFLVDKKYPISTYLNNNSKYQFIYQRDDILLYKKN